MAADNECDPNAFESIPHSIARIGVPLLPTSSRELQALCAVEILLRERFLLEFLLDEERARICRYLAEKYSSGKEGSK
jgi:hypothetical protein